MSTNSDELETLAKLSAELQIAFPASARLVGVRRSPGGMDDAVHAKLEVASGDFPSLLAQTRISPEVFRPGTRGMLGADVEFWDPHQSPALRTGQTKRPAGRVLNLGVDESRADVVVVYLVEHGT